MKSFNDFLSSFDKDATLYDIMNNLGDVSESQRTISKEEWQFIGKLVINSQVALLRQYHNWLNHQDNA